MNIGLSKAIGFFGSKSALADVLGVKFQTIQVWEKNKMQAAPIKRCLEIETLTQGEVTRKDLRPDDWQEIWVELIGLSDEEIKNNAKVRYEKIYRSVQAA